MKEERGRKKYLEKQPPDKPEKKNKVKYVAKQSVEEPQKVEERPHQKHQQRSNYVKPKKQYYEKPQFVERISSQTQDKLICLICSEGISKRNPIWTCRQCFISLHLRCIKQWIHKKNDQRDKKSKFIFHWDCVQCKHQYHEQIPKYYCFCGKYENPQLQRDLEPHSCGQICQRKRGTYCPHPCPQNCHSGKCKPCDFEGTVVQCHCGKSERMVKCSQERQAFQCGKKCQKLLNCKKHKCEKNCHSGPCNQCKKKHMAKCFCGKNEDIIGCADNSFGCEQECGKILDCGFHKCEELCHEGKCKKCIKTPELQTNCPCGRFALMMLSIDERQSCRDPIPVCGYPCKKKLSCGHECSLSCHEGKCSQCKVVVQQSCTCGSTSRKIECFKTKLLKEQFKCDKICKKRRSCGLHYCNVECCKFRTSPFPEDHKCQNTCQKMLNCGKHNCGEPCHAGLCKKCPVIYSQPHFCPCGSTSIKPPIVCGTIAPQCGNLCKKQLQCGHICRQFCHYGQCRCYQKVLVKCRCGRQDIETTCGRQTLCLNKCQKTLKCGHKCLVQCHANTCQQTTKTCYKKCDQIRPDCNHKCKQICHFGRPCESYPCQAEILIKCQCGHRQKSILCGNLQNTGKKKQITCNKKCENLKRFDILYKDKEIYYPNGMMQFGFKNFKYLEKLEERLSKFILESDEHFIEVDFKFVGNNQAKVVLHNLFQNHYHLNTHYYKHMKSASFTLMQTQDTMIPRPCLSQYIKQVARGTIKRTNLPFEYTVKFEGDSQQKAESIIKLLKPYLHAYYVERKDKMIHVHFWNKEQGKEIQAMMQKQNPLVDFYWQQNIVNEEEQEQINMDEIIYEQVQEKQIKKEEKEEEKSEKKQQILLQKKEQKSENTEIKEKEDKEDGEKKEKIENETENKPKIIKKEMQKPKIILRKSTPNFNRSQYPPSSQNVQDIYQIDEDELYNEEVDWNKVQQQLLNKKMGTQASEWRIRSLILMSAFRAVKQQTMGNQLIRILDMYEKDKQKARRILQIQKIDVKKIKEEMSLNQLYLSDHEPEITSYAILHNFFALDKITMEISQQCQQTREVQRAVSIIQATQSCQLQEFYDQFNNLDYILNIMLIPFVHQIRENFLLKILKKERFKAQKLHKFMFFASEEAFIEYTKSNNIIIEKVFSKSRKQNVFAFVSGDKPEEFVKDNAFIKDIEMKRDRKYFLAEPQELVDEKWMTRSFFAFGDFKESISPKYMLALSKSLKGA